MTDESPRRAFARTVGARIAAIRAARGISQEELGFRAEMHRTTIGQLERGERVPRLDSAVRVAAALGVSVDMLVEGIGWRTPALSAGGFAFAVNESAEMRQKSKGAKSQKKSQQRNREEAQEATNA